MELLKKMSNKKLSKHLDMCIDIYTERFCQKQGCEADGWIGQIKGGINCFSDCFFSFEGIRLDLEMNVPAGEIFKWYYENGEFTQNRINYYSYILALRAKDLNICK